MNALDDAFVFFLLFLFGGQIVCSKYVFLNDLFVFPSCYSIPVLQPRPSFSNYCLHPNCCGFALSFTKAPASKHTWQQGKFVREGSDQKRKIAFTHVSIHKSREFWPKWLTIQVRNTSLPGACVAHASLPIPVAALEYFAKFVVPGLSRNAVSSSRDVHCDAPSRVRCSWSQRW